MDPVDSGQIPVHRILASFPRTLRLTRPAEFERTLRRPDFRIRSGPLRIVAVENRMQTARLGLIVGKRVIAAAHARNRVKRIIRDRFRRAQADMGNIDMVVQVTASVTAVELHIALDSLFAELEEKALENSAAP